MPWGPMMIAGVVTLVATLAFAVLVPSRYIRGRLRFSLLLLLGSLLLDVALTQGLGDQELVGALARLTFVVALLNLVISVVVNPWREHRASDRFPGIVQDVTLIGLFMLVATVLMKEQLLTTSAV